MVNWDDFAEEYDWSITEIARRQGIEANFYDADRCMHATYGLKKERQQCKRSKMKERSCCEPCAVGPNRKKNWTLDITNCDDCEFD